MVLSLRGLRPSYRRMVAMQKAAELDEARRFGEDSAHLHVAIEHVTSEGGHVVAGRSQQARLSGKMARDHFAAAGFETTRIA